MAALLAGEGEVAHLVLGVAGALQHLDGDAVLAHRAGALDRPDQAASHAGVQRRPGLDGELVARDVRWPRRDHTLEGAPPADIPEAGHGVDEVAVDRGEARLAHLGDRVDGAIGVMHPSEELQRVGLEALHADADPVDPGSLPHALRESALMLDGLASMVTSAPSATENVVRTVATSSASSSGSTSDGVPPPMNTVSRSSLPRRSPNRRTSAPSASMYATEPVAPATLVKSQYSHFRSQNGMCR